MEVIKHGDPNRIEAVKRERAGIKKFICKECGCEYECGRGEYKFYDDQREGSWYEVTCPDCGLQIHQIHQEGDVKWYVM